MNDSLRTDVFVRFPPETIACACIFLAARNEKVRRVLTTVNWIFVNFCVDLAVLFLMSAK